MHLSIVVLLAVACSKPEAPPASAPAPAAQTPALSVQAPAGIDPVAARKLITAGAVVLDVRSSEEFADGHLVSATNVPVDDIQGRLAEIDKLVGGDKTRPIVTYCGAGSRAAKAKQTLEAA